MKPPYDPRRGGGGKPPGQRGGKAPDRGRGSGPRASEPRGPERRDAAAPAPAPSRRDDVRAPERRDGEPRAPVLRLDRPRPEQVAERPARAAEPRGGRGPQHASPGRGGPAGQASGHGSGHGIDAPRGAVWLYGTHAVASALANPQRRLRRLMVTEEAERAIAATVPQPWPIAPERTDRARLDQLLGRDTVHQGAALLADPLAPPTLAQIMERAGPILVLDQVSDPRNVGAILRSAAAFGVAAVITQERNAPEETGALAKAASGALEAVPLLKAVNIARTLIALKAAGCWVVGLDASGAPLSGPALAQRRVALVLGSEGEGLRRLTRDTCDEVSGIAMPRAAAMESLNVSAATAIALYELGRRA